MVKSKNIISKIIVNAILAVVACGTLLPFLLIVATSFTGDENIRRYGYSFILREINFDAYKYILDNPKQIIDAYKMTIFTTAVGTLGGIFLTGLLSYTISRKDFGMRGFLSFYIYFTMLFNGGLVASYIWNAKYLGLANTPWAIILPLLMTPWDVFMLRTYFSGIPVALIESAKLDGASEFRIFFTIIVPLAKTGIATIALLLLFRYWNDWFNSMLYMDTTKYMTIQYYLVKVLNNVEFVKNNQATVGTSIEVPDESVRMALCVVAAGPMTIIFPFFQKYFVKGLVVGSVKG